MKYYYKFSDISFKEFEKIWFLYKKKCSNWDAKSFYEQALNSYGENAYLIFFLYNKVDNFFFKEYIIDGYCDAYHIKNIDNIVTILPEPNLRNQLILDIKRIHNVEVL